MPSIETPMEPPPMPTPATPPPSIFSVYASQFYAPAELLAARLSQSHYINRDDRRHALCWRLDSVADNVASRHLDAGQVAELDALRKQVEALVSQMEDVAGVAYREARA